MKQAIIRVITVKVLCPHCKKAVGIGGDSFWTDGLTEEWDLFSQAKKITCPHCRVTLQWPTNPFKVATS